MICGKSQSIFFDYLFKKFHMNGTINGWGRLPKSVQPRKTREQLNRQQLIFATFDDLELTASYGDKSLTKPIEYLDHFQYKRKIMCDGYLNDVSQLNDNLTIIIRNRNYPDQSISTIAEEMIPDSGKWKFILRLSNRKTRFSGFARLIRNKRNELNIGFTCFMEGDIGVSGLIIDGIGEK